MKLGEIAKRLGCRLEGEAAMDISGVAGMESAQAGQLSFVANRRYLRQLRTTRAAAVIIGEEVSLEPRPGLPGLAALRSQNPYLDFARAIELFYLPPRYAPGVHPTAVVAASAQIGAGAHIGPYCYVDDGVEIGRNAVLHSFVAIYRGARIGDDFFAHAHAVVREGCLVGNRVILQNGVVVGGDGFGFAKQSDGRWYKMPQCGITVIEDDVEIQANACIDRATVGETRIRRGAKLDDLVLVGHASKVGEDTLLCGQVGLAGSTVVGNRCILAGQVGAAGHLSIGDAAVITSQSGVPNDVPAGAVYSGYPSVENKQWLRTTAALNRLPELQKTVRELQAEVARLRGKAGAASS
ncbi:MAG: UDP-3-O-(3-hydroxymyristoyl)glucosamine N-acyltransferase [Acidobacteria bacterium]|nr:UDP-3-O-(3-hydroxymyristoyl)glucosamine N-acyltransferase [Acidobacteriota bacterium]